MTQPANIISPSISAIMSVPRLAWMDHVGSVQRALSEIGIPLAWWTSAFWHKGMQQSINAAMSADWILTLDYDTLFNRAQLEFLLKQFGRNPSFDALAAMQPRRGNGAPLMTVKDDQGRRVPEVSSATPIKAYSAHFGMTLIRTAALKKMPKPWFLSQPDKDGEWSEACIDADIYFWIKWAEIGNTLYVEPNCRIGHLELMVSKFDEDFVQRHVSASQWRATHSDDGSKSLERKETKG